MTVDTSKAEAEGRDNWWKPAVLAALAGLLVLFGMSLGRDTSLLPSALIGKPLPAFKLQRLGGGEDVSSVSVAGTPTIINFWASWCGACRTEHAVIVRLGQELARTGRAQMIGVNHRDTVENAQAFLKQQGAFPYPSGVDRDGRTGIDFGVYGLPETFFVTANGEVVIRHVGPLSDERVAEYLRKIGADK